MKKIKISLNESKSFKKISFKKRNKEVNKKTVFLIVIFILIIINYSIDFVQFIKIGNQNKMMNYIVNDIGEYNINYNKLTENTFNILSYIKDNIKSNDERTNYFFQKLVNKASNNKNLQLVNNYIELEKLLNNDKRYDGARNCLVESSFNSSCIYNYLFPKKVLGKTRKLYGGKVPTSYVMLDESEFKGIKIAYSIGIGSPDYYINFDKELAERNIDVYMYDHTINKLPYENPKFHFRKIGIAGKNNNNPMLKTLEDMLKENGHLNEKNMILKVDPEGAEWEAMLDFPEDLLKNFRFMLFEFHFKNDLETYYKVLSKLSKYHQIYYVHCVNCGHVVQIGDIRICYALEVSYIIKEGYKFDKDDSIYPVPELDTKCDLNRVLDFNENIFKLFDY